MCIIAWGSLPSALGAAQFSPCVFAREIAAARVPISLVTGWLDQSATSALHIMHHAARAPGAPPAQGLPGRVVGCMLAALANVLTLYAHKHR